MPANPARLLAAARHLIRMEAVRLLEVGYDMSLEQRLSPSELVELTLDPADELITSLLLNTESNAAHPDSPRSIVDSAIRKAKGSSAC